MMERDRRHDSRPLPVVDPLLAPAEDRNTRRVRRSNEIAKSQKRMTKKRKQTKRATISPLHFDFRGGAPPIVVGLLMLALCFAIFAGTEGLDWGALKLFCVLLVCWFAANVAKRLSKAGFCRINNRNHVDRNEEAPLLPVAVSLPRQKEDEVPQRCVWFQRLTGFIRNEDKSQLCGTVGDEHERVHLFTTVPSLENTDDEGEDNNRAYYEKSGRTYHRILAGHFQLVDHAKDACILMDGEKPNEEEFHELTHCGVCRQLVRPTPTSKSRAKFCRVKVEYLKHHPVPAVCGCAKNDRCFYDPLYQPSEKQRQRSGKWMLWRGIERFWQPKLSNAVRPEPESEPFPPSPSENRPVPSENARRHFATARHENNVLSPAAQETNTMFAETRPGHLAEKMGFSPLDYSFDEDDSFVEGLLHLESVLKGSSLSSSAVTSASPHGLSLDTLPEPLPKKSKPTPSNNTRDENSWNLAIALVMSDCGCEGCNETFYCKYAEHRLLLEKSTVFLKHQASLPTKTHNEFLHRMSLAVTWAEVGGHKVDEPSVHFLGTQVIQWLKYEEKKATGDLKPAAFNETFLIDDENIEGMI